MSPSRFIRASCSPACAACCGAPSSALIGPPPVAPVVRFAGWRFDLAKRALISPRGKAVHLTAAEFQLLQAFVANANQVIGRDRLLQLVAGRQWEAYDRTVDQHISRLRRKLEKNPKRPELIKSVRGRGYLFAAQIERGR